MATSETTTEKPRAPVSASELSILKLFFSAFTNRKLPYIIVGLKPKLLVYTNVEPYRFDQFLQTAAADAYHFVTFKSETLALDLLYRLYPELKDGPLIINGPLWVQHLSRTFEPLPWTKTDMAWALDVIVNVKHETDEEHPETEDESGEDKPIECAPAIKRIEMVWFKSAVNLSPVMELYKFLAEKLTVASPVTFNLDPKLVAAKDITYLRISEKSWDYIGALDYYVRYPLVDGYSCISLTSYHRKAKPSRYQSYIVTWLRDRTLQSAAVYDNDVLTAWSFAPGTLWFPNKKNITRPLGETHV